MLIHGKTFMSTYPGLASLACAVMGLYGSFNLLERYNEADECRDMVRSSSMNCRYKMLIKIEQCYHLLRTKNTIGLANLAAIFALPKALVSWSIIFLATEVVALAFEKTNYNLVYVLGILLVLIAFIFLLNKFVSVVKRIFSRGGGTAHQACDRV